MFEAKLADASLLKKIIDAIKDLVELACFECTETEMRLMVLDSSHVALVSLKMEAGLFDCYRCDRPVNLGLSLANMQKAMKFVNNEDSVMIKFDENDGDSVVFTFTDPQSKRTQDIKIKTVDKDPDHLGTPDQDYSVVVKMPSADFQKTCKNIETFSDALKITATKAGVTLSGSGESGVATVFYKADENFGDEEIDAVFVEVQEPVNVNFSNKYMNHFTKGASLSKRVKIQLSNEVPVVVEFPIEEAGYLRYYLAPRIDEDNDDMD